LEMNNVVIVLGSNIEKEHNLPKAVEMLQATGSVTAVAPIYETKPRGLLEQPDFWNTAVLLQTELSPAQIKKDVLTPIERKLKRVRLADPNAPRTIDADIVLFNDFVGEYEGGDGRLRPLPDPDLLKFPHVAVPVAELVPDMLHPVTGERMADLAARLVVEGTELFGKRPLWPRHDTSLIES